MLATCTHNVYTTIWVNEIIMRTMRHSLCFEQSNQTY
uniref:Uncharacterized protein n=1 Tax=Rhizophora mucronata TaxID=61149 RepID=A0A2P2NMP6_RHIMU